MNRLLKRICGTSSTSPSTIWTAGREYKLDTHTGALRWKLRGIVDRWRNLPGDLRWKLSNRVAWLSMRLRGDKPLEGFHCLQNRPGKLVDDIVFPLICTGDTVTLTKDECEEIIEAAQKLGRIARADNCVDYWRETR